MAGGNNGDKTLTPTTLTNVRLAALVSHYFALSDWSFSRERAMGIRPAPSPGAKQAIGLSFNSSVRFYPGPSPPWRLIIIDTPQIPLAHLAHHAEDDFRADAK